jgi:hypothetical protein
MSTTPAASAGRTTNSTPVISVSQAPARTDSSSSRVAGDGVWWTTNTYSYEDSNAYSNYYTNQNSNSNTNTIYNCVSHPYNYSYSNTNSKFNTSTSV